MLKTKVNETLEHQISFGLASKRPSLIELIDSEASIDFLKQMQDKAIIVTSNSPYRKLINNGIRPHLVVTADPMEPTLAGFQNNPSKSLQRP